MGDVQTANITLVAATAELRGDKLPQLTAKRVYLFMEGIQKEEREEKNETSANQETRSAIRTMAADLALHPPKEIPPPPAKKGPAPHAAEKKKTPIIILLVVVVLALGGGAFLYRSYYSLLFTGGVPPVTRLEAPPPYFSVEATETLTIIEEAKGNFEPRLASALSRDERDGSFKRILIILKTPTGERYADLGDLFSFFGITPTSLFLAPIKPPLMPFAYFAADGPHFGFATKTDDRERVLLAMARWEETLYKDFEPLFLDAALTKAGIFEEFSYRNTHYKFLPSASDQARGIAYMVFPAGKYLVVTTSKISMERIIERLYDAL